MILVTGLPRAGTMSTARALEILGYNILFYCPLTQQGKDWIGVDLTKYDVLVDWSVSGILNDFVKVVPTEKIIFLTRQNGWNTSLENLGVSRAGADYVSDYNFGVNYARNHQIPFISLDIVNNPRWKELCVFLDKAIPEIPFPHLNKSDFNYTI